jgi:4-hydroxy-3-methylbut-2-en-1-yl diphosphate synthase IspG/GcpE
MRGEAMLNVQCPGCNRQIQVDIVAINISDLEQSSDNYDAQLQFELLKVQHDHSTILDWYQDMAERIGLPLHVLLAEALDLALPEVRKQHALCTFCGKPLEQEKG